MRCHLFLAAAFAGSLFLSSATLAAEESSSETAPEVPDVLLSISAGDIQRSRERLRSSIYGQLAATPMFADAREGWAWGQNDFTEKTGVDAASALADFARAEFRLTGFTIAEEQARMHLALDLGDSAAALWPEEMPGWSPVDTPPGANAAAQRNSDNIDLARFANLYALRFHNEEAFLRSILPSGEDDLRMSWRGEHLRAAVQPLWAEMEASQQELFDELYARWGDGEMRIRFLPDGITEQMRISGKDLLMGSQEVDQAVIDRLPADALMALAVGINGPDLRAFLERSFASMADADPEIMAEVQAEFHILYSALEELQGTASIALLPPPMGAPFPGISIQLPWSDVLQELSQPALAMLGDGLVLPEVGAQQRLRLPTPMPLPVPLLAARSSSHLLITTVPGHARNWLAGEAGGFTASPVFQQALSQHSHGQLYLIGASDTPRIITLLQNLFDSFGAFAPAQVQEMVTPLLEVLATHQGQGYLVAGGSDTLVHMRSKGLIGSIVSLPMAAGMVLPAITQARARAHALDTMNKARQINMAMFHYTETYNRYPRPPEGVAWPEDPRAVTAAIFEELAHQQELPYALFRAADDGSPLNRAPRADVVDIWSNPNLDYAHSFAFDWNAPRASPAMRPILATRYPVDGHKGVVVFGDYSAQQIPVSAFNEDGSIREVINPRSTEGDNIFAGDEEHDWSPGARGPRNSAWVR